MPFAIVRNDITKMRVDAIVNAANSSLLGGGGVDGMIHRAAGPSLLAECRTLGGCPTGEARITGGYRLPARYVIHTVGPVWHGGGQGERALLVSCYRSALALARDQGCESLAFPLISAGAYGYPKDQAMEVAVETITHFLLENEMMVYLVVFGREEFFTGKKLFRDVQEYIDDAYAEQYAPNSMARRRGRLWRRDPEEALQLEEAIRADAFSAPAFDETGDSATVDDFDDREMSFSAPRPAMPIPDGASAPRTGRHAAPAAMPTPDWEELLRQTDEGFSQALLRLIDEKGMTDAQCYKKANVDRRLFSKIRSDPAYRPSKPTVLAFAMALELSLPEARDLLNRAGFSLTRSSKFDLILEYFLQKRFYDINQINLVLFNYDLPLLGSGMMG